MTHTAHIAQEGYTNHILQPSRNIGFEPPKLKRDEPGLFGLSNNNEYFSSEEEDEDERIIDLGMDSDDDDPTNTAMFLDESEERELDGVTPGTPMAFRKLEQMTAKSINRQRESQTPGRTQHKTRGSSIKRHQQYPLEWDGDWSRYENAVNESPTKRKGNSGLSPITSLEPIKVLTDINPATKQTTRGADDTAGTVPLSIQKIRSSRRAGNILSKIRAANNNDNSRPPKPLDFGQVKDLVGRGLQQSATTTNAVIDMERIFNSDEHSSVEFDHPETEAVADGYRTPPNGNRDPHQTILRAETPYTLLRTLSGMSNFGPTGMTALEPLQEEEEENGEYNDNITTPTKRTPRISSAATTPMTQPRERIDSLKRLYRKHIISTNQQPLEELADGMVTPVRGSGMPANNNLLISFENSAVDGSPASFANQANRAPGGLRWDGAGVINLLESPSPVRLTNDPPARDVSKSSLPLSFSSKANQSQPPSIDPKKQPIAYLLNHVLKQHQENLDRERNNRSNLLDMSSRLNSSIYALNSGLRDHLNQSETPEEEGVLASRRDLRAVRETMERVENDINQSLASMVPKAEDVNAVVAHPLHNELDLEEQVSSLRQTMLETKEIVFAIQNKLDQQQQQRSPTMTEHSISSDSSKLDDIVRLLGALDMRLHMLEDRQRLDHKGTQRTNSGSVKLNVNKRQQKSYWGLDMLSQIGQFIAYCLGRYPFMLLGALFIILLSELLVIGSFSSNAQSLYGLGSYVFEEVRKQFALQMPLQDIPS